MVRKTVLVTGTSSGIGRVTAEQLLGRGFHVLAGVRREDDAPPGTEPVLLDVTDAAAITAAKALVADRAPLVGLVNNAGVTVQGPLEFLSLDELRRQLEVNVVGPLALTQALLPALRAAHGRVVMLSSIGGRTAVPFLGPYHASKWAIEGLSDALRQEVEPTGVKVAIVEPGSADTEIWRKGQESAADLLAGLPPEARELYGQRLQGFQALAAKTAERSFPPSKVADAIVHALTARRPRPRYLVGADARIQLGLRTLLPTRALDAAVRRLARS
ncbi:MAG TPA: SDR family NAD(P)-dependent oxidoreductase [Solirubrobacteraceae bacterium]|jgi:NAD(P)-dependent dehydrogenase (short-subunit alcohol dehydrogenase family)